VCMVVLMCVIVLIGVIMRVVGVVLTVVECRRAHRNAPDYLRAATISAG
jgi:hypothetical protein